MALSDDHLRQAVDEAMEPSWPRERRRALHRWAWSTAGRVAAALLALFVLGLIMQALVGVTLPWVFFGFIGALMAVLAFLQSDGREHLRQQ